MDKHSSLLRTFIIYSSYGPAGYEPLNISSLINWGNHHWPYNCWPNLNATGPGTVFTRLYFLRNLSMGPKSESILW